MKNSSYTDRLANDYISTSMVEKLSFGIMFLATTKEIQNTLKEVYDIEKNIYKDFEVYERQFYSQLGKMSVLVYYLALCDILDE